MEDPGLPVEESVGAVDELGRWPVPERRELCPEVRQTLLNLVATEAIADQLARPLASPVIGVGAVDSVGVAPEPAVMAQKNATLPDQSRAKPRRHETPL